MTAVAKIIERQPNGLVLKEKLESLCELLKEFMQKENKKFPEVMTATQVQEYLQISNQTFYNLKNERIIKTISIGGNKRYLLSQINNMLIDHLNE
jgi:hypothetical protein